jgi:hypothetical protein
MEIKSSFLCSHSFQPRPVSAQPSKALQELLEKLGQLCNRHDVLQERVDKIEVSATSTVPVNNTF